MVILECRQLLLSTSTTVNRTRWEVRQGLGKARDRPARTCSHASALFSTAQEPQGLQTYGKSAASWQRALELVSNDNSGNAKLREDYQQNLTQAQRLAQKHGQTAQRGMAGVPNVLLMNSIGKKHPWDRAKEMLPRLRRQGITRSSVRVYLRSSSDISSLDRRRHSSSLKHPM